LDYLVFELAKHDSGAEQDGTQYLNSVAVASQSATVKVANRVDTIAAPSPRSVWLA
jgi:hypothetical protein